MQTENTGQGQHRLNPTLADRQKEKTFVIIPSSNNPQRQQHYPIRKPYFPVWDRKNVKGGEGEYPQIVQERMAWLLLEE